jgi:hypothetical protein
VAIDEVFRSPQFREHMSKLGKKGGARRTETKRQTSRDNLVKANAAKYAGRRGTGTTTNG